MMNRNGWTMLVLPAIALGAETYPIGPTATDVYHRAAGALLNPGREPQQALDDIRRSIGTMNFAAQYQQNPIPDAGNIIQREWIQYYDGEAECYDRTVMTWDLASTLDERSSFSVGLFWGAVGSHYHLLEVIRQRLEAPALRKEIIRTMREWQPHATIVEETELGRSLVQEIHLTTRLRPLLRSPRLDKTARLLAQAARFEAGEVFLPRSAPWLGNYLSELLAFPYGRHDDQVDATSLALHYFTEHTATRPTFDATQS